jgi:hypothetical protein
MRALLFIPLAACATAGPSTTVTWVIHAPIEQVFSAAVAEDVLPKVLHSYGPVPAVTGTLPLHGPWETVGADRVVLLEGGGRLHEQITAFTRPSSFAYQIDEFEGTALRTFARRASGNWVFTEVEGGTRIEWTYAFEPRACVARPVLAVFASTFYRGYMKQALELLVPLATTAHAVIEQPRTRQ